ncbi:MAG: radical SAM protein [Firmicutes bacterium]|nr:radical SAM protein [Bacillota bacterium]
MRILLIQSGHFGDKRQPMMPLSLPVLAGTAPDHSYTFCDLSNGEKVDFNSDYDLVGISIKSTTEPYAYDVADKFRGKGIPVILGGPHVTGTPFEALNHADAVAVGEGEKLWPVIIKDIKAHSLKQIYVCNPHPFDGNGYSVYQDYEYVDLAMIHSVSRGFYKKKYQFDTVFTTRGCPVACDFCSVTSMFGSKVRIRPIDDVIAEIDSLGKLFFLIDDNIFGGPGLYDYYLELYEKMAKMKTKRYWMGQANLSAVADLKGRMVIDKAIAAGLIYGIIGLESVNGDVLENSGAIRKSGASKTSEVMQKYHDHISFLKSKGLAMSGWFVIGYPKDTIYSFSNSIRLCNELNITPGIASLRLHPGTKLFYEAKKDGSLDNSKIINWSKSNLLDTDVRKGFKIALQEGFTPAKMFKRTMDVFRRAKGNKLLKTFFFFINEIILKNRLKALLTNDHTH